MSLGCVCLLPTAIERLSEIISDAGRLPLTCDSDEKVIESAAEHKRTPDPYLFLCPARIFLVVIAPCVICGQLTWSSDGMYA